jgi:flagellar assembly factor FliW
MTLSSAPAVPRRETLGRAPSRAATGLRPAPAPVSAPVQRFAPPAVLALTVTQPMPGFPGHHDFVLVPGDATGVLLWLQSVAPDGPRFLAVVADAFFPDYAPEIPAPVLAELELIHPAAAQILCLVTVPADAVTDATANLRAPVVVNRDTSRARQVVLTDGLHPIRRALRR